MRKMRTKAEIQEALLDALFELASREEMLVKSIDKPQYILDLIHTTKIRVQALEWCLNRRADLC